MHLLQRIEVERTARYSAAIKFYGAGGVKADSSVIDEKEFMEKLPETAKNAIADACTGSNPRQPSQEEMEKLLKACYYDLEIDF